MARQNIGIGTSANDGTGDVLRDAFEKTNQNFTELYGVTGWESKFEPTSQSLTASNNLITITGTSETNGGLTLLNSSGKVVPINLNDVLSIDFGCTVVTPSGTNNYIHLKFIVNSVVYRAITIPLLKGSGNDDAVSLSASMPVGSDFNTNGMEVYIEPSDALSIKDKYISVNRTHLGL